MRVKQPFYFWIAVLLTLPLAYFLIDRTEFVLTSKTVMSTVEDVWSENDRCGGKRRRNCTKFHARLLYHVEWIAYRLEVGAGNRNGHNQPIYMADHAVGQQVRVAYDPDRPGRAYRDSFWDIWGAPLLTFFFQIFAFFGGFSEPKRDD